MTLLKCPKCGCNHIWKNSICSSCGFNTRIYMKQLLEDTKNMNYNERRKYISDTVMLEENKDQMIGDILMNMDLINKKQKADREQSFYNQPIISCPACNKNISSEADFCIHCGYPLKKKLIESRYRKPTPHPTNQVRCPKCGSISITTEENGYGLFGWIGASQKKNLCQNCGYKWWPGSR